MKELEIKLKKVTAKDQKSGRPYEFEKHFVTVNGIEIGIKPKGTTAYDRYKQLIEEKAKLSLRHEVLTMEMDGNTKEYDSLYIQDGDEHLPMVCYDSYGKQLVIKALRESVKS